MKACALFAVIILLLSACSGPRARLVGGRIPDVLDERPEASAYFEAVGIGASDPALPTETQRRALARDAAIVQAQYELLSMIKGVELDGGYKISRAIEVDSTLETKVNAAVRGAEVLKSEFTSDGGCVVTLRLPKRRLGAETGLALR
ncbi:MAG: hypothetical protein HKL90_00780 [Elusimicrobia bacterium]|nr:hypothetical protein [Elusimicrobiota bacterium]